MAKMSIPLVNGLYVSETQPVSLQQCKNFYVNIPDTQGISKAQLFPSAGLNQLADSGENNIGRGSHILNAEPYFVNGNELVRLESNFTLTVLGTIDGALNARVSMADNGNQLCIVVFGTGTAYIYTKLGGLQTIVDPSFTANGNAEIVVFIDGYFVFTTDSKKFFISALNDGLTYSALDFGTAEADPDQIRSAIVHKSQLFIFGSETIEVFQNVGGVGFPFRRITGFVIPKGIVGPFTVAEFDGSFCWIGAGFNESPKIYRYNGSGAPEIISNTSIDFFIQSQASDIDFSDTLNLRSLFVWTYTFRGATFIGWSGPQATLVFDAKASRLAGQPVWHQRESQNLQNKNRWRVNGVVTAYGRLLVNDSEGGIIGEINNDVLTDYNIRVVRVFSLPTMHNIAAPIYFYEIECVIDSGQTPANVTEGELAMRYSNDARNFTSKVTRKAGAVGEFSKNMRWTQLGYAERYRIFEFSTDDPIHWVIMGIVIRFNLEDAQN